MDLRIDLPQTATPTNQSDDSEDCDERRPLLIKQDDHHLPTTLATVHQVPGYAHVQQQEPSGYVDLLPHRATPVITSVSEPEETIRTYWWRWVVLTVFCLNLGMNNIFWITASPIADVIGCYYDISNFWVNSLSSVYMIVYIVFAFPFAWMLDRFGIRLMVVLGSCANAIGAGLRVAGSGASFGFWLLLAGQGIVSFCNVLIWGAAPLLSEVWFPPSERATATAFSGAISSTVGLLLGIGLGPILVHRDDTLVVCGNSTSDKPTVSSELYADWSATISNQLFYYLLGQAALSVVILFLTFVAFPNAPPSPPSLSRKLETSSTHSKPQSFREGLKEFVLSILKSLTNVYFLLFLVTSGIMVGAYGTILTVINEMVNPYFNVSSDGHDKQIGYLGITCQASAFVSMIIVGRILDWTKAFYAVNVAICVSATASVALLAALVQFQQHFYFLYIAACLVGVTLAAFQATPYEYAVEMTYPLPEGTSAGIVNIATQIVNFAMIEYTSPLLSSAKLRPYGIWALAGVTGIGALAAVFTRPQLRRLKIDRGG